MTGRKVCGAVLGRRCGLSQSLASLARLLGPFSAGYQQVNSVMSYPNLREWSTAQRGLMRPAHDRIRSKHTRIKPRLRSDDCFERLKTDKTKLEETDGQHEACLCIIASLLGVAGGARFDAISSRVFVKLVGVTK